MELAPEIHDELPAEVAAGVSEAINVALIRPTEMLDSNDEQRPMQEVLDGIIKWFTEYFTWMKSSRAPKEVEWQEAFSLYTLDQSKRLDSNRSASVYKIDPDDQGDETGSDRAALNLPIAYDNVEQIVPRYYDALFGNDPNGYVELRGREINDENQAAGVAELLNYQQEFENNTPKIGQMFCRSAALYGTGLLGQTWDFASNTRRCEYIRPVDLWPDPAAPTIQECRFLIWRRKMTVQEVRDYAEAGKFAITKEQMDTAIGRNINEDNSMQHQLNDDPLRQLTVDIWMEPDRWIYVVNEMLVVAIAENPLWDDNTSYVRYPIVDFTPVSEVDDHSESAIPRGIWGISPVFLSRDSVDMQNSIMYLMNRNMARSALGVFFGDSNAMDGITASIGIQAGKMHPMRDPKNNLLNVQFPDISAQCTNTIAFMQKWDDRLFGVNDSIRGEQSYSTQTASATNQMLSQAGTRIEMASAIGNRAMREFYEIALRYNQKFLDESMLPRIIGESANWGGMNMLNSISGKDLIPTGSPTAGSRAYLNQNGLNLCSVLAQFKQQGFDCDPLPLLRDTIKAMGLAHGEQIAPKRVKIGQDPDQENEFILQGMPVMVGPNDNHRNHYESHLAIMYQTDAREIMQADPALFMAWENHLMAHSQVLDMEAGAEGGESAPSEGYGSGSGTAGQNMNPIAARPKPAAELEAQVNAG